MGHRIAAYTLIKRDGRDRITITYADTMHELVEQYERVLHTDIGDRLRESFVIEDHQGRPVCTLFKPVESNQQQKDQHARHLAERAYDSAMDVAVKAQLAHEDDPLNTDLLIVAANARNALRAVVNSNAITLATERASLSDNFATTMRYARASQRAIRDASDTFQPQFIDPGFVKPGHRCVTCQGKGLIPSVHGDARHICQDCQGTGRQWVLPKTAWGAGADDGGMEFSQDMQTSGSGYPAESVTLANVRGVEGVPGDHVSDWVERPPAEAYRPNVGEKDKT